jgi:uncharacterized membrane protein
MDGRTNEMREHRPERRDVLLWFAVLAGPLAWVLTEQVSYDLAPTACFLGRPLLLYLVPASCLLIVLLGVLVARRQGRREPAGSTERGEPKDSRIRFMALAGFWLCLGFALVILATAMPPLLLRVCD